MVEFGKKSGMGYFHPMDREYGHFETNHSATHEHGFPAAQQATNDVGVSIGDLGMSVGLGPVPNVQAIQAKIRPGGKKLEFVFTGMGKGQGQSQTPGMYGKKQREALAEIGRANKVDFTTHSTVGVYGLAGMDQQGNFSKTSKDYSLQEVKRAIEFAADVAQGGPVVVHTGEFQRPLVDADWNQQGDDPYKGKFKMYSDEDERASWRVVDTRTGAMQVEARKNRKVARPVWNRYGPGSETWDENNGKTYVDVMGNEVKQGDYVDYHGNFLPAESRVPKYDYDKGQFKARQLDWNDLKQEAVEMTNRAREIWQDWKSGKINEHEFQESRWTRFKDAENINEINVRPEEAFMISTLETNAANSRGWAYYYGAGFKDSVEQLKKLQKAYDLYKKIEDATDEEEKWKLKRQVGSLRLASDLVPSDSKYPTEILKDLISNARGSMQQGQEASASQWAQAEDAVETIRHIESAETYAFREAVDAYAQSAMSAMRQSQKLKEQGKLKKPITVAMENLFPESYGSHPDELIKLVSSTRKRFEKLLHQQGVSEEEAQKRGKDHITATFDTGHLNMWRKYWQGDPKKSIAQNDQEFNKWSLDKLGQMVDAGVIGHVHLDDNYGFHDDHLAPGEGNAPIRDMVKLLKEKGYNGEMIVEPGADYTTDVTGFHSVMKTWRHFGTPVYGSGSGLTATKGRSWEGVGYGWFGQNQPPYFTFGSYSPSEDWTLWSNVPLE
jgi:sugar phosphate isomerase/epimerase